jgi:tRNA pseudouridine32 synthase/23S rRNA pseudouridine746 synthase
MYSLGVQPAELILWEDETLVVVNKPAGLLSLPDGYDPTKPHLRSVLEPETGRLWIVHRLDRETSGVLVLARTPAAHRELNLQLDRGEFEKVYLAILSGRPCWSSLRLELPLKVDGDRRHRTVPDPLGGKPARTDFQVLACHSDYAWAEAILHTGRTHQIRAHAAALGHPLLGDRLYAHGMDVEHPTIERLGLHALQLSFFHPIHKERLVFTAPYPADLASLFSPSTLQDVLSQSNVPWTVQ